MVEVTPVYYDSTEEIKSDPFDPDGGFTLAETLFRSERYADALVEFVKVMEHDPSRVEARFGAGESFLALGKYHAAAKIYWDDEFNWPDDEAGDTLQIGRILSGIYTDRFENQASAIHDGMVLSTNDARLWNAKGQWHDRRAEWMDALVCYVTAMDIGERHSGTINNMGMSLMLQGRYEEALGKFSQAKYLSPKTEIYDNNLRMSQIMMGELRSALSDIDESRGADILNDAGFVAYQRGQIKQASKLYQKAIEISPVHHVKAQANLDLLRQEAGLDLKPAARSEATRTP